MAYEDGSRVALKLLEIEQAIQETNAQLQALRDEPLFMSAEELAPREREFKLLADRLQSLHTALQLQQQLASEELRKTERQCADGDGKKMKYYGYREVKICFLGGLEIKLWSRYYARNQARADKCKGAYFGLLWLGIHDHCSPALASEVAKLAAAMNSLEDAKFQLEQMGVKLPKKQIAEIAYAFSRRARLTQQIQGMGIGGSLAGKRVVISTDGGRVRIRTNKKGKRTTKGRRRYRTDWREPKLLAIYVVDEDGKIDRSFTPVLDGTLKGPDAVFGLIEQYLSQLGIDAATNVLFIADGAKWIWKRVGAMFKRLGLKPEQCMELVDFYHVVEHLHVLAGLKKKNWSKQQKRGWVTRQTNRLKAGEVTAFTEAVRKFTKGQRGKDWRRERDYLLRNASAGRLNYGLAREQHLPIGSGIIESTVRRVLNLRMKGASIFWTKDNAEDMILLRAYYKSGHWQTLENNALTNHYQIAA
jgi:hypothetical protein